MAKNILTQVTIVYEAKASLAMTATTDDGAKLASTSKVFPVASWIEKYSWHGFNSDLRIEQQFDVMVIVECWIYLSPNKANRQDARLRNMMHGP